MLAVHQLYKPIEKNEQKNAIISDRIFRMEY